tara:strand:+ start:1 stop:807 length:807 start_codon:yes stop_codon:yes gene_type:complete
MKFSIITTFHNSEEHILDCLNSVKRIDDNLEYEHILVDDGSLDNSRSLILANLSEHQRLVGKEKIGRGRALNLGIRESKGEFICILDSDDMIAKEWIEFFFSNISERETELSGYSVFFGKNFLLNGSSQNLLSKQIQDLNHIANYRLNTKKVYFYNPVPHLGVILRSSSLKCVGYYTEARKSQFDWDLWLKLIDKRKCFYYFDVFTGTKRIHDNQSFEVSNHFIYTLRGVKLQLYYSLKSCKHLFIFVLAISCARLFWSLLPRQFRLQ